MTSILVLGGAHIDRRGRISGETAPGASNPGAWKEEAGGGGFNAARNLARLGHRVTLISPRGGDAEGEAVEIAAEAAGVIDRPFTFSGSVVLTWKVCLYSDYSDRSGGGDPSVPWARSLRAAGDRYLCYLGRP